MNYFLLMTSAGSILFVGELLLEKVMGKHMSQACRYRMLVAVVFAYLLPWVWLKGTYIDMGISYPIPFGLNEVKVIDGKQIMDNAVYYAAEGLVITPVYRDKMLFLGVWLGIAVIVMLVKCSDYFHNRHRLLKCAQSCGADVPEELVQRLKQEFNIRCRVRVVRISIEKRSFTLGLINPVVFLQKNCRADEIEQILRHEFTHIARGDLLVKMLMQLACCMHWANPLIYWLNRRLDRACEKACDEKVIRGMSEDEKDTYACLVLGSMRELKKVSKRKTLFGSFLSSNEKHAEERIRAIMNTKKTKLWEKIVVAGVFAVLLFVDSLTALAYPRVYDAEVSAEFAECVKNGGVVMLVRGDDSTEAILSVPVLYDEQIITADGEILPVQEQRGPICFHNWEDDKLYIHEEDGNGGCIVTIYACKYCIKCAAVQQGDKLNTITFNPCIHKGN